MGRTVSLLATGDAHTVASFAHSLALNPATDRDQAAPRPLGDFLDSSAPSWESAWIDLGGEG